MSKTSAEAQRVNEQAAKEFSRRVLQELSSETEAVVLFGSVARGESHKESDVDVLLIAGDRVRVRDAAVAISEAIDSENDYRTLVLPLVMTPEDWSELVRLGAPIARAIADEGKVLYDKGFLARTRGEVSAVG